MNIKIKEMTAMIMAGIEEWEWSIQSHYVDLNKVKMVRFALKSVMEMYASLLPKERKILDLSTIVEKKVLYPSKVTELYFSNKNCGECENDIDFHFDILAIQGAFMETNSQYQEMKFISFNNFNNGWPFLYSWATFQDYQIMKISRISNNHKIMLQGRFADFDICGEEVEDKILTLPNRYLQPIINICSYELAKMISKESKLESLRMIYLEAVDKLKEFKQIGGKN